MPQAIETVNLTRVFGALTAVDGLDLTVETGTFFGFLGPNGAGKSTTIKVLTGLLRKSSGEARVLGFDLDRQTVEIKRRIGVVPEELALFDRLTAIEYLTFVARMYGVPPAEIASRADELLVLMDLHQHPGKMIVDFSHGMRKKTALAAALIHQPRMLFLDEPFEGIDAVASRQIKDLLRSMVGRGVTVFLTSHILEIVEKLCTEMAVIHRGKLVAQGTMDSLRQRGGLEAAFLELVGDTAETPRATLSWLE